MLRDRNGAAENSGTDGALRKNTAKVDRCRAIRHRLVERFENLRTDLVAPPAYRRPEMHMEVLGTTRKTRSHRLQATLEDTGRDPTPTSVHGGNGSASRIDEEHGHAVRDRDCHYDPRRRGGMPITHIYQMWIVTTLGRRRLTDPDVGSVDLSRVNDRVRSDLSAEGLPSTPRGHGLTPICKEAQVEWMIASGLPCRRSLYQPRERLRPLGMDERGNSGSGHLPYKREG